MLVREAVQPIVHVLHKDEALPESPGDSSVYPSKPFETTRQEPVSYLGSRVNRMQVCHFPPIAKYTTQNTFSSPTELFTHGCAI